MAYFKAIILQGFRGGSNISMGSQMLISIVTLRIYNFSGGGGGGHFIASANIKVLGEILHPWQIGFAKIVLSKSSKHYKLFLKKLLLVTEKTPGMNPFPQIREVTCDISVFTVPAMLLIFCVYCCRS